jgi:L-cysteine desulfidase
MEQNSPTYKKYIQILKEELIPAMGCTEPISIAYGASYVRDLLEDQPDRLEIEVSGNLIKNAKSVVVPNTNGMCGIAAAAVAGVIAGVTEKKLEVISQVS